MKKSDINHLRKLLGWVSCEVGMTPEDVVHGVKLVAPMMDEPSEAAKQRLVEWHDKARSVPTYVRAAINALSKAIGPGYVVNEDDAQDALAPNRIALPAPVDQYEAARRLGLVINFEKCCVSKNLSSEHDSLIDGNEYVYVAWGEGTDYTEDQAIAQAAANVEQIIFNKNSDHQAPTN